MICEPRPLVCEPFVSALELFSGLETGGMFLLEEWLAFDIESVDVDSTGEASRAMRYIMLGPPRLRCLYGTRNVGRLISWSPESGGSILTAACGKSGLSVAFKLVMYCWYSSRRDKSQKKTLEEALHIASTGFAIGEPGNNEKRMNISSLSGIENSKRRVY